MDLSEQNKVIAFDTLFSTNHIQMLKIILSYMDNQTQKSLAVYIKFLELNYTIHFYKQHHYPVCGCTQQESSLDISKMCGELLPYCTEEEKKQLEQIQNIFKSMKMYKEMSKTMEMMKEFMPEMENIFQADGNTGFPFDSSGNDTDIPTDACHNGNCGTDSSDASQNSNSPFGNFDMMNILMNMLSPEQKEMFNMFGGNNHAD